MFSFFAEKKSVFLFSLFRSFFMKASFLIKAREKGVIAEKGVRAFIPERLLNSPFERATAFNLDEKTVEVRIEGDEKKLKNSRQNWKKNWLHNSAIRLFFFQGSKKAKNWKFLH